MARRLVHQQVYKNARGKTPPWKDLYRKRCLDRLRASRARLVDKFRAKDDNLNNNDGEDGKMVKNIMELEWSAMKNSASFPSLREMDFGHDDGGIEDEAALLLMMEQIQKELQDEEERMIAEVLNYDAASLASQVESLQSEEVICPVCQVQGLQISNFNQITSVTTAGAGLNAVGSGNLLICRCGLFLHGANLTISQVKASIENTVLQHGQLCVGKLLFAQTTDTQGSNVLVTCQHCDWMSFLL